MGDFNPLVPKAPQDSPARASAPLAAGGGAAPGNLTGDLDAQHSSISSIYSKLSTASKQGVEVMKELRGLAGFGAVVAPSDVIESFGRLVGHGLEPMRLADILADMPTQGGGEAIQGWIAQRQQIADRMEAQLNQHLAVVRHELGVSALRLIASHHFDGTRAQGASPVGPPAPAPNPLSPSSPTAGAA